MARLSILTCCLFYIANSFAQPSITRLSDSELKGKVKSVTSTTFKAVPKGSGFAKKEKIKSVVDEYNKAGQLYRFTTQNFVSKSKNKHQFFFDKNNRLIGERDEEDGDVITATIINDTSGAPIEMKIYDASGKLQSREVFEYTPVYLDFFYDTWHRVYDARGVLREETVKSFFRTEITYSATGKIYQELLTFVQEPGGKSEFGVMTIRGKDTSYKKNVYGDSKVSKEIRWWARASRIFTTNFEYDDTGMLIRKWESSGENIDYAYTYDKQKNWVRQVTSTTYRGATTTEITERVIKYY